MKKFFIAATFAALAASPALAATQGHHYRNTVTANDAYAYALPADAVVVDGKVIGADPDQFIRGSLIRQTDPADLEGN